ncbi:MAG: TerC family protein [Gemmatimonadales bacterium]
MGSHPPEIWIGFTALVVGLLALDLGVLNRHSHVLSVRESARWSGALVSLALLFGGFLWWREGAQHALEYYTGYLVELSLSVDNLFVFIMIFQYFGVPPAYQARVLKWGVIGAIVMRAIMIGVGALLLERFDWIVFVFGAILILTGIKMFRAGDEQIHPEKNLLVRLAVRVMPFTRSFHEEKFVVRLDGRWMATPLLLVLIVVEWSDLVFAVDSIPAIFAITRDPFIVYSSNIFAVLGLRALYFLLAGAMQSFRYLKPGVALILLYVGVKMMLTEWFHLPTLLSLGVIIGTLTIAVIASLRRPMTAPESGPGGA